MDPALGRLLLIAFGRNYLHPAHQDSQLDVGNRQAPPEVLFSSRTPWWAAPLLLIVREITSQKPRLNR
jgi:hypothetical protein